MEESNPELESFRQQWRAEVSAKARVDGNKKSNTSHTKQSRKPAFDRLPSTSIPEPPEEEDGDHTEPQMVKSLGGPSRTDDTSKVGVEGEPKSALEHYEKAVERETQGSLGDSLGLYRKAFRVRLDAFFSSSYSNTIMLDG